MKKLRLTNDEQEMFIQDIIEKFDGTGKYDISSFEYTKADVKDFLEALEKLNKEKNKKPTILINSNTYTKMYELVKQSPIEIQWHMLVTRDLETQTYLVYDLMLFPQTNSGTSTTTDQDEFAKWQTNLIKDTTFPIQDLRGHGHSHVNMNVYSSGIDDAYQRDLITKVDNGDFYLFLVLNKKMDMYALLYDFVQQTVFETSDMDIQILDDNGIDIRKWCKEQIEKNCKTYKPTGQKLPKSYYYAPNSSLKLVAQIASAEELIVNITDTPKGFFKRRK